MVDPCEEFQKIFINYFVKVLEILVLRSFWQFLLQYELKLKFFNYYDESYRSNFHHVPGFTTQAGSCPKGWTTSRLVVAERRP